MKKKIISLFAIIILLVGNATAQVFCLEDDDNFREGRDNNGSVIVPNYGSTNDLYLPLGDGALLLAGLAGAYLIGKKHKK